MSDCAATPTATPTLTLKMQCSYAQAQKGKSNLSSWENQSVVLAKDVPYTLAIEIVERYNRHERLVAALRRMLDQWKSWDLAGSPTDVEIMDQAEKALAEYMQWVGP